MSMLHAFAMLCAIGMVGRDDEQLAKRLAEAEMRLIEARLQLQEAQWQVQLAMEQKRPTAEQRVQETRRARVAEARMRSTVEAVSGPVIGDAFRSSRRPSSRP